MKKTIRLSIQLLFAALFVLLLVNGRMVPWLLLFAVSWAAASLFGRFFCGYVCPMNTFMGAADWMSKKLHIRSMRVPGILKSRVLPWVVLAASVSSMLAARLVFHRELPVLPVLLVIAFVMTLRWEPWVFHNHVCPFSVLLKITGRHARLATRVDETTCVGCAKCVAVCSAQAIDMDRTRRKADINPGLCHQCTDCIGTCPVHAIGYRPGK